MTCCKICRKPILHANNDPKPLLCLPCAKTVEKIKKDNDLENRLDKVERECNWHNEQSDKELAESIQKTKKLKKRIDAHDRIIVELLDRIRELEE